MSHSLTGATGGHRYALCVGIGQYTELPNRDLRYATEDAKAVANVLEDSRRGNFEVTLLTDPTQTTRAKLDNALDHVLNAPGRRAEDLVVIYFSCHGEVSPSDNIFCLLPSDAKLQEDGTFKETTVLNIYDLANKLSRAKVHNIIMFLDACHSGGAGRVLQYLNNLDLSSGPNLFILGAAQQGQFALQSSQLEHGLFTNCLLRAFEQPPNKDGWLTISHIESFVSEEIELFVKDSPIRIQGSSIWANPNLPLLRNPSYPELCPLPPFWNVPLRRNPFFTEQDDLLARLANALQTDQKTALTQPQAISGLGGIGKTQLAVEYAYRHRQDYHAILWARANTREALISSFVALADLLDLPEKDERDQMITANAVKVWLGHHSKWLLILDNADELVTVNEFIPSALQGHLLLTTRAQVMGELARKIEVEVMKPEIGALLLLRRARILANKKLLKEASAPDISIACDISQELGGLPLALDQAGAYIEETQCSLADYKTLYQTRRSELLRKRGGVTKDYPDSVATTWSLAFQKIEHEPAAADLLRLCAFLYPDAIPEEIITKGFEHLGPHLQVVARDPMELNKAIRTLRDYSLIHRDSVAHTLSIHRLVQAVLQDAMKEEMTKLWTERAIRAVKAVFPSGEFKTWSHCESLLPHALACASIIKERQMNFLEAADLLNLIGYYLLQRARYAEAWPLLQHALVLREQQLGPQHPDTAKSINNLATLYFYQGKYEQAEPLMKRALAIFEQQAGPDQLITAITLDNLSQIYKQQRKYEQAEPLMERALAISRQQVGSEHLQTAYRLNNLAELYRVWGKYDQAEPLYQRALAIFEQQAGPDHPDTAQVNNNLGLLYYLQGRYDQAEPLYRRALAIKEQQMGPENADTALTVYNLALLYFAQDKYEQAEPLMKRALAIFEQQLGPEHHYTAMSINNLATLYQKQAKLEQAEPLMKRALAIFEQQAGPDHPDTAQSLNNLALLHYDQGKYEQAEPLLVRALAIKEQQVGPENVDTALTVYNLARLYRAQGKYEQAEPLIKRALAIFEQQLGPEHPHTVMARQELLKLQDYLKSPETVGTQEAIGAILAVGIKAIIEALNRKRAALGVNVATVTPELTAQNNLSVDQGVLIESETPNGPAATAGLKPGDVIVQIDNTSVIDIQSLADVLLSKNPGDTVALTAYRGSQQMTFNVQLGELQASS